ncbi:hypothetical protein AXF42_Ash010514 [Apostasia shenzhenica]|uniref:Uncharacterized protein n=1 Tax=Apostasia shenzhenica TaxID=1088818 RepID=A0A2I0A6B3_9ASPA|nr:hypothetical protein AXF42_Ash010514 [Apostasia shenzhenica]
MPVAVAHKRGRPSISRVGEEKWGDWRSDVEVTGVAGGWWIGWNRGGDNRAPVGGTRACRTAEQRRQNPAVGAAAASLEVGEPSGSGGEPSGAEAGGGKARRGGRRTRLGISNPLISHKSCLLPNLPISILHPDRAMW